MGYSYFLSFSLMVIHPSLHTEISISSSLERRPVFVQYENRTTCLCVGDVAIVHSMYRSPLQGWTEA